MSPPHPAPTPAPVTHRPRLRLPLGVALAVPAVLALLAGPGRAQQRQLGSVHLDSADVIGWRQLTRADFRGERPPDAFALPSVRPVAVSCAFLVPDPTARILAVPRPDGDGVGYRAHVEGLRFRALLSRTCSWWNANAEVSPAYVLQHEQIHFDIFEVAARQLNKDLPGMLALLDVEADDAHAVVVRSQAYIQGLLRRALDETAKRNADFDRETSYGFELARQGAWRTRLDHDLEDLRGYAADDGAADSTGVDSTARARTAAPARARP